MKMASLGILLPGLCVLIGPPSPALVPEAAAAVLNPGPHGFSEVLYAFSSCANNNGSAFAGLTASTPFHAVALGLAMLIGRYGVIVPVLAVAGSLAGQESASP